MISVDELRTAGALDVPPTWRKSLGGGQKPRAVYRDLFADEEDHAEDQPATGVEPVREPATSLTGDLNSPD